MAAAMSKQNARQHAKRKGYYERQYDRTGVNKTIAIIRHMADYGLGKGWMVADTQNANRLRDENRHHLTLVRNKLKAMGATRLLYTLDSIKV